MSMLSQTYIGKYYEGSQELSVSTKSIPGQDNDSYVILGESGYGKSVAAQSIMLQKAYQGHRIQRQKFITKCSCNISKALNASLVNHF